MKNENEELTEKTFEKVVGGLQIGRTKKGLRDCPDMECDPGIEEDPVFTPGIGDHTPLPDPEHGVTMSPKMR